MTLWDYVILFVWISVGTAAFALVVGIYFFKYQNSIFRYLIVLLFLSVSADLVSIFLNNNQLNVAYATQAYGLGQFIVVSIIYYKYCESGIFRKMIILIFSGFLIGFTMSISDGQFKLHGFTTYYSSLSFICFSLFAYYHLLQQRDSQILLNSIFWLNTAIFLFYSGNFIYYLLSNFLDTEGYRRLSLYLNIVQNVLALAKNFTFVYTFYLNFRNNKLSQINA